MRTIIDLATIALAVAAMVLLGLVLRGENTDHHCSPEHVATRQAETTHHLPEMGCTR